MSLVRFIGADGSPVYVRAENVTGIGTSNKGTTAIKLGPDDGWFVQGTPDEVHAALFPGERVLLDDVRRDVQAVWDDLASSAHYEPREKELMRQGLMMLATKMGVVLR